MRGRHCTRCRMLLIPGATALLLLPLSSPLKGQSRLSGQVLASESRMPIAGATIEIPSLRLGGRSDSAGRFLIDGLAVGDHQVIIRAVSFDPILRGLIFERMKQDPRTSCSLPLSRLSAECALPHLSLRFVAG